MRAEPIERLGANVERERGKFHDDLEALCLKANRWFSVEEMHEILTAKAAQYVPSAENCGLMAQTHQAPTGGGACD